MFFPVIQLDVFREDSSVQVCVLCPNSINMSNQSQGPLHHYNILDQCFPNFFPAYHCHNTKRTRTTRYR
jgi:hypothetical protein